MSTLAPSLLLVAMVVTVSVRGVGAAADAVPPLPCILNHGCVCNHSDPTINALDGQTYGTCTNCSSGWTGAFCDTLLTPCLNGGTSKNSSSISTLTGSCDCPVGWGGRSCETAKCLHSVGGVGPFSVASPNATSEMCDSCDPGWTGLQCSACGNTAVCQQQLDVSSAECDSSMLIRGPSKHLECQVTGAPFLRLLGPHRPVQGRVTMDCHSTDFKAPFLSKNMGQCSMAFIREEPNATYALPFFFCTATNCSVRVQVEAGESGGNGRKKVLLGLVTVDGWCAVFRVVLIVLCGWIGAVGLYSISGVSLPTLGVLGCFVSPCRLWVAPRILGYSVALLVVSFVMYTGGAVVLLTLAEAPAKSTISYGCDVAHCVCGPDPSLPGLSPLCSSSTFGTHILPLIKHGMDLSCHPDSQQCVFVPRDVPTKIPLSCIATECVDTVAYPMDPSFYFSGGAASAVASPSSSLLFGMAFLGSSPHRRMILAALVAAASMAVGLIAHNIFSRRTAKRHAAEFTRLFWNPLRPVPLVTAGEDDRVVRDEGSEGDDLLSGGHRRAMSTITDASELYTIANDDFHVPSTTSGSPGSPSAAVSPTAQYHPIRTSDDDECSSRGGSESDGSDPADSSVVATAAPAIHRISLIADMLRRSDTQLSSGSGVSRRMKHVLHTCMASPFRLEVRGLSYSIVIASGSSAAPQILRDIHFTANSGELVALMGPSGAGKTTLLDLLAMRPKASGVVAGGLSVNGIPIVDHRRRREYRGMVGYVSQEDTLLPSLTVRETVLFAARLKLPCAFSESCLHNIVDGVLEALKLQRCADTLVGDGNTVRGVSGGERRRVSIAVEYIANPRILFLDEPTSGLDAVSAQHVMNAVSKLSRDTHLRRFAPHFFAFDPIVICSIHQPSAEIFEKFDKVLLLSQGVSVFYGPATEAVPFLVQHLRDHESDGTAPREGGAHPAAASLLLEAQSRQNPADALMRLEDLISAPLRDALRVERHLTDQLLLDHLSVVTPAQRVTTEAAMSLTIVTRKYYPNVWQQRALLTSRAVASLMGGSIRLVICHALVTFLLGLLLSVLYRDEPLDLPGSLNRAGSLTFLLLVVALLSLSALDQLISERKLFAVEKENRYYATLPFFVTKLVVDLVPLRILPVAVLGAVIYFPMGFRSDSGSYLMWFLALTSLFAANMALLVYIVGILFGSFGASALVSVVVILWDFVFGGLMVQSSTMPALFEPFRTLSPFFVTFEALLVNELNGQMCSFAPTDATGQPASVPIPLFCVQYLENLGLHPTRFFADVLTLCLMLGTQCLMVWLLLSRVKPVR